MDRRRSSSSMSHASSFHSLAVFSILEKGESTWFERYQETVTGQVVFDTSSLFDILKDLFEDNLDESAAIHLLSLIETFQDEVITGCDILEQTIGTLMSLYNSIDTRDLSVPKKKSGRKPRLLFKKKLLSTICTLFLSFDDWVIKDESMNQLFDSFIDILLSIVSGRYSNSNEGIKFLSETLLIQINQDHGGRLESKVSKLSGNDLIFTDFVKSNQVSIREDEIKLMTRNFVTMNQVTGITLLHNLLRIMINETFILGTFSPIIFKPIINQLINSGEIFHLHFLILLYQNFRMELFNSQDELKLMNQLIIQSRHPSLSISHRLICLEFCYSLVHRLKFLDLLNVSNFRIQSFDGSDSIEKKLKILQSADGGTSELLSRLKQLKTLSLMKSNERATKSLYRILNLYLKHHSDSVTNGISDIVQALIVISPKVQLKEAIKIINKQPKIRDQVFDKILNQALINHRLFGDDIEDLKVSFSLFEFIIRTNQESKVIKDDDQIANLFKFLLTKTKINQSVLASSLLDCVATAIRSIEIDTHSRIVITDCLNLIHKEMMKQSNITKSSWAQIYLIAIGTLQRKEQLQQVFTDCDTDQTDRIDGVTSCPISIKRMNTNVEGNNLAITFDTSLDRTFLYDEIFALDINIECEDQDFSHLINLRYLFKDKCERFIIKIPIIKSKPSNITFDFEFSDISGSFHQYLDFHSEMISFSDILIPGGLSEIEFTNVWKDLMANSESFETLIRTKYMTIGDLFDNIPLLKLMVINGKSWINIRVIPDQVILGSIKKVDGRMNVHLLSSNWSCVDNLYKELFIGSDYSPQ